MGRLRCRSREAEAGEVAGKVEGVVVCYIGLVSDISDDSTPNLSQRLALRLAELREQAGWSLQTLADRSGVSRSMISSIERVETNPTAVVLDRLATALGLSISQLFDGLAPTRAPDRALLRHADQALWRDPASGYERRSLSPPFGRSSLRLVSVHFAPLQRVAYDAPSLPEPIHQEVWLISGQMAIRVGDTLHQLQSGDCLAMALTEPVEFHNPGAETAHYLVATAKSS
jgi:transcriptional regulator with XRE-family HTH domain